MKTFKNNTLFTTLLVLFSLVVSTTQAVETITYYHNDALGSPVAATDEAGNVKWREEYQPYGSRLLKQDGGTNDTWFTGKQEDKSNGLSYFGARWYDPVVGRFTGIDPVGFQEGNTHSFNRYAYANNNPYKYVDPDGRHPVIFAVIGWFVAETINLGFEAHDNSSNQCGDCVRSSGFGIPGPPAAKAGKGLSKGLGDLTSAEAKSIQKAVDDIGSDLYVVGSAASGKRRNINSNLPIGKGKNTKSDIDYVTNNLKAKKGFDNAGLPGVDPGHGVLKRSKIKSKGKRIHFRPNKKPTSK